MCAGTVRAEPRMDANHDAQTLEKAMKGMGTDEQAIINLLARRSASQRCEIAAAYKASFGKDLKDRLHSELSGKFRQAVLWSFYDAAHVNARACYKAIKGSGTDEDILIDVICTCNNEEMEALKHAYQDILAEEKQNTMRRNLEVDVKHDVSGDFEKLLIAVLQGKREQEIDNTKVARDAEDLYKGGVAKMGTDEATFTRIFATRSYPAIRAINDTYQRAVGHDLAKAIEKETSGDYKRALLTVFRTAMNRDEAIADILYDCMDGAGTHDDNLIRTILAYSETSLSAIRNVFNAKYTKTNLHKMIKDDTSGDYEKYLLAILGEF